LANINDSNFGLFNGLSAILDSGNKAESKTVVYRFGGESSMELLFSKAKVPLNIRSREWKFHGTGSFALENESSTSGTFVLGSESSWERMFQHSSLWHLHLYTYVK